LTRFRIRVLVLACGVLASGILRAQDANLAGTITDPSGGVVSEARLTLTDTGKNSSRSTSTNSAGLYSFPQGLSISGTVRDAQGVVPGAMATLSRLLYRLDGGHSHIDGWRNAASTATSFHPVNTVPANGAILLPGRSKSYEAGQKWQTLHRRLIVNATFRRIIYHNLLIPLGGGNYDQAGHGTQLYPGSRSMCSQPFVTGSRNKL
jgi:hypothetical protein